MTPYVSGIGPQGAKLMIAGDFPGQSDEQSGHAFSGIAEKTLDGIFSDIGISNWRGVAYATNYFKYRPPGNDPKKISQVCNIHHEREKFWEEIETVKPNCILALSDRVLTELTGHDSVFKFRGSILLAKDGRTKVVPTIHPHCIVRPSDSSGDFFFERKVYPYIYRWICKLDITRAIEESNVQEYNPPQRLLRIAKSSGDVFRHIQEHRGLTPVVDIETFRSVLTGCLCLAFTKYESLSIPLFNNLGPFPISSIPTNDLANIWQILDRFFQENQIIGHNLKFDQAKLELLGFTFPRGIKSDTQLKLHLLNPELPFKSLVFGASIWTREPHWKEEGKEFNFNYHPVERWYNYNAKDGAVNKELDDALEVELKQMSDYYKSDILGFYYNHVVKLHKFYYDIEKVGFRVDAGQRQFLIDKYETWADSLKLELIAQLGYDLNVNSPKQVAECLYEDLKLKVQYKYGGGYDTSEEALAKLLDEEVKGRMYREVINNILMLRRVTKTLGNNLYSLCDYDGRMRTQVRITGTETGRSSNSVLDEPIRPYKSGFAYQTLTKHGDIGQDVRSYLLPKEGYVFVNIDLSQAEARVVAVLSEDYDLLTAFDTIDIHRRTAALALFTGKLILSGPDEVADKIGKESPERFIGKKTRHAGNYDMKWKMFMTQVVSDARRFNIENVNMSPFKAKQILERFHLASPKIRGVFHKQIREEVETKRFLITPHGRPRRFYGRFSDQLYQEAYADIPQGTVIDNLRLAGLEIMDNHELVHRQKNFPILCCGESHDALLFQMPKNEYKDICKEIRKSFEKPIDFRGCSLRRDYDLVIPCDMEVGDNYLDMEKVR
jgi:uracil-DNA glycosylase family 4